MKTTYVTKVLMCQPDYFQVEYQINPWMKPGSVNKANAMRQWLTLVKAYQNLGIEVEIVKQKPDLPDMVFSADQAITKNKNAIISNFTYKQRQPEPIHYLPYFLKNNIVLHYLPKGLSYEGSGESLFVSDCLLIGSGFRSSKNIAGQVSKILDTEVEEIELIDERFYHLDTCFFPLNSTTAFYYPKAFSEQAKKKLKKRIPKLIPFTQEEVNKFAANSMATDHHVLLQNGIPTFKKKLEDLGYKTVEVDVSEFIKAGGGIHCLTQVLETVTH